MPPLAPPPEQRSQNSGRVRTVGGDVGMDKEDGGVSRLECSTVIVDVVQEG